MNRNHIFNKTTKLTHNEVNRKVAIHEAGHAAAIYLGNKQKELPPVYFQIYISPWNGTFQSSAFSSKPDNQSVAKVEGGRLIHTLPSSIEEATSDFSFAQKLAYERAFEADIINLLVGPLAEAKYIALRDGELINPLLVNLNAIHYYGGSSDLESVNEYLECLIINTGLREQKIMALFLEAFSFVNDRSNWHAISALADYILAGDKGVIEYDEITRVLEANSRWPSLKSALAPIDRYTSHTGLS
jgi:hypothetical protein